jgi:hypothetical protein
MSNDASTHLYGEQYLTDAVIGPISCYRGGLRSIDWL